MNSSIDQMRERAREIEERNRRFQEDSRRQLERTQDRQDAERRHRERLRATSSSGDTVSVPGISFKTSLTLIAIAALIFGIGSIWDLLSPPNENPADRVEAVDPTEASPQPKLSTREPVLEQEVMTAADGDEQVTPPPATSAETSRPPSNEVLRPAILRALESGSSTTWRSGNQSGNISVSAPVGLTGKVCRSVGITFAGPTDQKFPVQTWCRAAGESWAES